MCVKFLPKSWIKNTIAPGSTYRYPNHVPARNSPTVADMNGHTYFFSFVYIPGEINSHTWYRMNGDARIAPPTSDVLMKKLIASVGCVIVIFSPISTSGFWIYPTSRFRNTHATINPASKYP